MPNEIIIDRDDIIDKLNRIRSLTEPEQDNLRYEIEKIINLLAQSPVYSKKSSYPRIGFGR